MTENVQPEQPTFEQLSQSLGLLGHVIQSDSFLMNELEDLIEYARMTQKWKDKLIVEFPTLKSLLGSFTTEVEKRCLRNSLLETTLLTEAIFTVKVSKLYPKEPESLWLVTYCDQDYPNIGAKKGVSVRRHTNPNGYDVLDAYSSDPDIWSQPLDVCDPIHEKIFAMALYGSASRMLDYGDDGIFLKQLLGAYKIQRPKSLLTI